MKNKIEQENLLSKGAVALAEILKDKKYTHITAGLKLKCSSVMIGYMVNGERRPGFPLAYRLWKMWKIPMESWFQKPVALPVVANAGNSDAAGQLASQA